MWNRYPRDKVSEENYDNIARVDLPTEEEYEKLKQCTYNDGDQYKKENIILAANYHLLDKPDTHDETINNFEFIETFYHHKNKTIQFSAATTPTVTLFIPPPPFPSPLLRAGQQPQAGGGPVPL